MRGRERAVRPRLDYDMETMREHVVDYTAGAYRAAASVGWYTRIFLSPACRCTEKSSHMAPYQSALQHLWCREFDRVSFVMLLKAARRVEVCPASTLAAVLLSGLAGGVAEPHVGTLQGPR